MATDSREPSLLATLLSVGLGGTLVLGIPVMGIYWLIAKVALHGYWGFLVFAPLYLFVAVVLVTMFSAFDWTPLAAFVAIMAIGGLIAGPIVIGHNHRTAEATTVAWMRKNAVGWLPDDWSDRQIVAFGWDVCGALDTVYQRNEKRGWSVEPSVLYSEVIGYVYQTGGVSNPTKKEKAKLEEILKTYDVVLCGTAAQGSPFGRPSP